MRRFNPDKELNKIRNGNKNKILYSVIALLLIVAVGSTYALYQVRHTNKMVYTTVEKFVNKDIILSVKLDDKDESVNEFPTADSGYFYSHTECEKENITDITWNEDQRSLNMNSKGPDKCTVYFSKRVNEFAYNGTDGTDGSIQEYKVPKTGDYKLEVWGAQGGAVGNSLLRGLGGYSVGEVHLNQGDILYIAVGGQGQYEKSFGSTSNPIINQGGFNGAGNGGSEAGQVGYGGGGATHIATVPGLLSILEKEINNILIIAGGGGGAGGSETNNEAYGGNGGGYHGTNGINTVGINGIYTYYTGTGATQNEGGNNICNDLVFSCPYDDLGLGRFGQGGSYSKDPVNNYGHVSGAGGGGGLYGGGGSSRGHAGAGGGSGYIGNDLLTNKAMYCYQCTANEDPGTLTYSVEDYSSGPISKYAKQGNGFARITYLGE